MENLEENYYFQQEKGREDTGCYSSVIYGKLINNKGEVEKFIALKKASDIEQAFKNEISIFEFLQEKNQLQECVVKYYGTAYINGKTYIVMENLKKQGFETIGNISKRMLYFEKQYMDNGKINSLKRATMLDNLVNNFEELDKQKECLKLLEEKYQKEQKEQKTKTASNNKNKYLQLKEKVKKFFDNTNYLEKLEQILQDIPIYHNDIHENNVMINLDTNEIKLIDFGLSFKKMDTSIKKLNESDETSYTFLKSVFYCLLIDEIDDSLINNINNKYQQSF